MKKPVRNLSLGERMKCEIAAGLLHRPKVLFLDEPTIGLDITGQARIREFLWEYNKRTGATILLTSHYMADVTALCERIIIIHHGNLKYDGGISSLSRRIAPFKLIGVLLAETNGYDLSQYGTPVQNEEDAEKLYIQVKAEDVTRVTSRMLADLPIHDISIADPPIEDVIERALMNNEYDKDFQTPLAGQLGGTMAISRQPDHVLAVLAGLADHLSRSMDQYRQLQRKCEWVHRKRFYNLLHGPLDRRPDHEQYHHSYLCVQNPGWNPFQRIDPPDPPDADQYAGQQYCLQNLDHHGNDPDMVHFVFPVQTRLQQP